MRKLSFAATALAGVSLVACGGGSSSNSSAAGGVAATTSASYTCQTGTLKLSGSTALQPLAQKAATSYQQKCPGSTVTVGGGGSKTGLTDVAGGQSDIGNSDVPISNVQGIDASQVTDHQVAIVVGAVVVNPKAGVTNLSVQQIRDLFAGKVTNWKGVGGSDVPVTLIERKPGSGSRLTFDKTVMQGTAESGNPAATQDATPLVISQVGQSDGGVSYAAVSSVTSNSGVKAVTIDGIDASKENVAGGKYGFYSHEHMYTKGAGSPLAQSFINYILSTDFAGQIEALGFAQLSLTSKQSAADV